MLLSSGALASDVNNDGTISVLVPIAFSPGQIVNGTFGSQWAGEVWVHNASSTSLASLQGSGPCIPVCQDQFPPGALDVLVPISNHQDGGAILNVPPGVEHQVHFSARLYELSRRSQPTGVDVPVIKESQFFTTAKEFLGIPVDDDLRVTVRVYDPRARRGTAVRVEILDFQGIVLAGTTLYPGNDFVVRDEPPTLVILPGMDRILNVVETFPQVKNSDYFQIRVTPLDGMTFWAFVSVTDNSTQHVLLITAQP